MAPTPIPIIPPAWSTLTPPIPLQRVTGALISVVGVSLFFLL
jgi:hypothetical protein